MKRTRPTSSSSLDGGGDDDNRNKKPAAATARNRGASRQQPPPPCSSGDGDGGCLQTPHTLRLLKLIREGTPEYAQMAILRLEESIGGANGNNLYDDPTTKTSSRMPLPPANPIVLWDLLGRLQDILLSSTWKTRQAASEALQVMSKYLPIIDQTRFLLHAGDDDDDDDGVPCRSANGGDQPKQQRFLYLTVAELRHDLDTVLDQGRELLAKKDDDDGPDHTDNKPRSKSSDDHHHADDDDSAVFDYLDVHSPDYLEQRVSIQRKILAERLGLGGIANVIGSTATSSSLVSREDLLLALPTTARKRQEDSTRAAAGGQEKEDGDSGRSIRALLVLQMKRQQEEQGSDSLSSHRSPQTLLATELLYRMSDPVWYIRHGAILGLLALIRSWKETIQRQNSDTNNDDNVNNNSCGSFGIWPQDILARCLCVLALDRFGDYSGSSTVAPVREIAGQLVAVLCQLAPPQSTVRGDVLSILHKLCENSATWEVRHGALIALKYMAVVETTKVLGCPERHESILSETSKLATKHLVDTSDDVKSVAAQILVTMTNPPVWEAAPVLWNVLGNVRVMSSCIVDLVSLFTLFVETDCSRFLNENRIADDPVRLSHLLLGFFKSDFMSVRVSALRSLGILTKESSWPDHLGQVGFSDVILRVFEIFFMPSQLENDDECVPNSLRDETWDLLSVRFAQKKELSVKMLELNLLSLFFRNGRSVDRMAVQVDAAEAIAMFFVQNESCTRHVAIRSTILAHFQSPFMMQCESALLLYRALRCRLSRDVSLQEMDEAVDQEMPLLCLRVAPDLMEDPATAEMCSMVSDQLAREMIEGTRIPHEAAASAVALWTETLKANFSGSDGSIPGVQSMRARASVAGAVVAKGLPPKITSLVRALMTAFNNEREFSARQDQTCCYLIQLLVMIGGKDRFKKAYGKILDTLCQAVLLSDTNAEVDSVRRKCAARMIQSVVQTAPDGMTLRDIKPIWMRLEDLRACRKDHEVPVTKLLDATLLLQVILEGISPGHAVSEELIDHCASRLVEICCRHPCVRLSESALYALAQLCSVNPKYLLERAIPVLTTFLAQQSNADFRLPACHLLETILEKAGTEIWPYVRSLLPLVLSLMPDDNRDCAQTANSIFASLVRVAPLVQRPERKRAEIGTDSADSVIDHLIFGEPLPPCRLPEDITGCLATSNTRLRQYQVEGVAWLRFLQEVGLSGALCDDMGLGKTLEALTAVAIAHSSSESNSGSITSLVICPSTLVGHWTAEIEKFFPSKAVFRVLGLVGSPKERKDLWQMHSNIANIIVTSYAVLRTDVDYLETRQWCYCILDEGHLLKNPKSATARASRRLKAKHRLILTGTPIQNRVHELWATFDFLMPNFLGSSASFAKTFASPIAKSQLPGASARTVAEGLTKLKLLHQQVLPFILRREKEKVLAELPAKTVTVVRIPMSGTQAGVYENFCRGRDIQNSVGKLSEAVDKDTQASSSTSSVPSEVLRSLLFLRLLCTHPSLVLSDTQREECPPSWFDIRASGKMLALAEILKEAGIFNDEVAGADNDTSLIYCEDEVLDDDDADDECDGILQSPEHFAGSMASRSLASSFISRKPSKCLVFAQFTRSLDAVESFLLKAHMPSLRYVRLDGSVSPNRRMDIVHAFNQDPDVRLMLLTTRVGGLGLSLTAANVVIFLEIDFNPFADIQAIDRTRRIGQTRVVNVYKLITSSSIEEKILELQEKKLAVSNSIVNTENSTMYSMGTNRLLDIFAFRNSYEGEKQDINIDYDLEGLVERCSEDYASLSVDHFTSSLR